jgi:hypothetical protein
MLPRWLHNLVCLVMAVIGFGAALLIALGGCLV